MADADLGTTARSLLNRTIAPSTDRLSSNNNERQDGQAEEADWVIGRMVRMAQWHDGGFPGKGYPRPAQQVGRSGSPWQHQVLSCPRIDPRRCRRAKLQRFPCGQWTVNGEHDVHVFQATSPVRLNTFRAYLHLNLPHLPHSVLPYPQGREPLVQEATQQTPHATQWRKMARMGT